MSEKSIEIKAGLVMQKPAAEVFEAIVDPAKMSNYFISKSSGRMEEGKVLTWNFPEIDKDIPVKILKIEGDKYISFRWQGMENAETLIARIWNKFTRNAFIQLDSNHIS